MASDAVIEDAVIEDAAEKISEFAQEVAFDRNLFPNRLDSIAVFEHVISDLETWIRTMEDEADGD